MKHRFFQITSFALLALGLHSLAAVDKKNILMLAGNPSHGPGEHEHNAGIKLLARCLSENATGAGVIFHLNAQWPSSEELAKADTIVMYADGGGGHPALQGDHLQQLAKEMKRGCGFVCLHYAVEVPVTPGGPEFKDWLGGYFEPNWSVNPHWEADFKQLPQHPVCNGVKPFATSDEWYFHMRFRDGMKGVTPILTAIAPDSTMSRKDGPHEGNLAVRDEVKNKVPQHTAWAVEREDGGRGFGFTGGHFHKGWGNNDQRRLVLNAILWTAKMDVPANGVDSKITDDDLQANLDPKGQPKPHAASTPQPHPAAPGKSLAETGIIKKGPEKITASLKGLKELYLIATDGGDSYACDWADWAEPVLIKNDGTRIKLTELKPKMAHVGWGELGINKNAAGNELKINGKPVSFGFGAHAPSMIAFDLPEGIAAFESSVGVDNGGTDQGELSSVTFALYASNPEGLPQIAGKKPSPPSGPPYGLEAARKQMENFKTPAGLEAKLFAAEPMVQNPTNIDVDPQGRVWIAECVNYRHWATPPIRPEGDRIVVLEDTTGDGEADKETTFYQSPGLTNPLGLCVLPSASGKGTQVIVSAAPNVWLLTDTDGDGKADKAEILFKVGGEPNYDHQIHAFCFGPDGIFYFNGGNSLTELFWPDGSIVKDLAGNEITGKGKPYRQGMIFRCDINLATGKASNVETLGHNFRNNYEVCVDSLGGMWQSDNDDDGNKGVRINNIIEYGNYGFTNELDGAGWQSPRTNIESEIPLRHWHQNDPGTIPNLLQTGGGSPTGICVNEGGALGTAFENQLIHCDAGPRTVRAYPAKKNGAGYTAEMVDILTSSDNWYRPADCCIAPDGSLFIADWYDSGVGGHNMGDHDPKTMRGRIYRVAVTGQSYKITPPDFSTADGCATALLSPNNSTRFVAWTKLHAMGVTAEGALKKTMTAANPRYRARALHLLARTPGKFQTYIDKALADESADVRATAVREIRLAATDNTLPDSIKNVTTYIMPHIKTESDKQVLREYAITLRVLKEPQDAPGSSASNPEDAIAAAWVALAGKHDGNDRWYLESLGIGSMGREDRVLKAWLAKAGDNWNTPAGRDIIWRVRSPLAFDALVKILTDKNTKPEDLPHYLREFDFLPDGGAKSLALLKMLGEGSDPAIAADVLRRLSKAGASDNPEIKKALELALASTKGKPGFITLVKDLNITGKDAEILDASLSDIKDQRSMDGLKLILKSENGLKILTEALATPKAGNLLSLLGGIGDKKGLELITATVTNPRSEPALRSSAVKALALSPEGAQELLTLSEGGKFPEELKSTAGSALAMVQFPTLSERIVKAFPPVRSADRKELPPISELVKLKGDAAHGKAVFAKAESSCTLCHRIGETGVDFAPALTEIGSKLGKDAIYDSIINPNAGISMGFETSVLTLKNGQSAMGIVRSETKDLIVLALPGGVTNSFGKNDVKERKKLPTSMMPPGLQMIFSQQDFVDLVEYLSSLKAQTVKK